MTISTNSLQAKTPWPHLQNFWSLWYLWSPGIWQLSATIWTLLPGGKWTSLPWISLSPALWASLLQAALGCRGEPALNFLGMWLLFSLAHFSWPWRIVCLLGPCNIFPLGIFWLHTIYPSSMFTSLRLFIPSYHLPEKLNSSLLIIVHHFFQSYKNHSSSDLAPSTMVLTKVLNPMSWESTPRSMNSFLCSLIFQSPQSRILKTQSQGYFPDFCWYKLDNSGNSFGI